MRFAFSVLLVPSVFVGLVPIFTFASGRVNSLDSVRWTEKSSVLDVVACLCVAFHCETRETHELELLKAILPEDSKIK